jgi:hypothetical protein
VLYRSGKFIWRKNNGFVIGNCSFLKKGKQVAFYTNTVYGDKAPYYEVREILIDKMIEHWQGRLTDKFSLWAKRL